VRKPLHFSNLRAEKLISIEPPRSSKTTRAYCWPALVVRICTSARIPPTVTTLLVRANSSPRSRIADDRAVGLGGQLRSRSRTADDPRCRSPASRARSRASRTCRTRCRSSGLGPLPVVGRRRRRGRRTASRCRRSGPCDARASRRQISSTFNRKPRRGTPSASKAPALMSDSMERRLSTIGSTRRTKS
jgi:hypothetical protein